MQAICDSDCKFVDLVAAWPDSVHDSRIFKTSVVYDELSRGQLRGIFIGDNGYGLQPLSLIHISEPTDGLLSRMPSSA